MYSYRVRVMISESQWFDTVIQAPNWSIATQLGRGQSPIGQASFLGEGNWV